MMLVATIPMKLYDGVSNPTMVLLSCISEWVISPAPFGVALNKVALVVVETLGKFMSIYRLV